MFIWKKIGWCQKFSEEQAEWYVPKFGGNFVDMQMFIDQVLKSGINQEAFLRQSISQYSDKFKSALKYPDSQVILDHLLKNENFGMFNPYSVEALTYLTQSNVIGLRLYDYTWNKPLVRVCL